MGADSTQSRIRLVLSRAAEEASPRSRSRRMQFVAKHSELTPAKAGIRCAIADMSARDCASASVCGLASLTSSCPGLAQTWRHRPTCSRGRW